MSNVRKREIDLCRGFGIILMIMGHIEFGDYFGKFIHVFHVPLFFFISGMLFKIKDISDYEFLKKKTRAFIIPYISFGVLYLMIALFQYILKAKSLNELLSNVFHVCLFNTEKLAIAGAIWYLTAIFFVEIIFYYIKRYVKKISIQNFILIAISILGFVLGRLNIKLILGLEVALVGLMFFNMGYLFNKNSENILKYINKYWGVFLIIACACSIVNGEVNLRLNVYSNEVLFLISSTVFIILIYCLFVKVKHNNSYMLNEVEFIGKNSIVYLCVNEFVLYFLKTMISMISNNMIIVYILKFLILIVSLGVLHILSLILSKKPFSIVIGR